MQSSRFLKGDTVSAIVILAFAVIFWIGADRLPKSLLGGGVGADGLPKFLAVALGVLSLILLVQSLLEKKRTQEKADEEGEGPDTLKGHLAAFGILVIGGVSVLLLPIIGYVPTVALLLVAMAVYHGQKLDRTVILYGVGGALFMYVLFEKLLAVPMPAGIWPGLLGLQS